MTNSRVQDDMVDKDYHVLRNPARLSTVAGKAFRHMGTEAKFNFLAQKMIKNLGGTQTRPCLHHCLTSGVPKQGLLCTIVWTIVFGRLLSHGFRSSMPPPYAPFYTPATLAACGVMLAPQVVVVVV